MKTARLRVTLCGVTPRVLRVLDVPVVSTLPELHALLQVGMGWTDSHLHQFVADGVSYGVPSGEDFDEQVDEAGVALRELSDRFTYRYDFGDGWQHEVEVLGPGREIPGCVFGEGACPPEDCGGPSGYAHLLEVLAGPANDEQAAVRQWLGGWVDDFDQQATDVLVRQTVGETPGSVRLVLDLLDGGVRLTPGGRLPRALVRQVQERRPHWCPWGKPASIEEDLPPLAALHDLLRQVGLARLQRGVLTPTRAVADDLQVVRRLRKWSKPDSFEQILAGVGVAVLASRGPARSEELAAAVHPMLGHRWVVDGRSITPDDVRTSLSRLSALLEGLDLVERDWPVWRSGPSARTLLPRTTSLVHLWSQPGGWSDRP